MQPQQKRLGSSPPTSCALCSETWSTAAIGLPGCSLSCKVPAEKKRRRGRVKIYTHNLAFRRCNTFWDKNQYSRPILVKFWGNFWREQLDSNVILLQCWYENKSQIHVASLLCKMELLNRKEERSLT